MKSLVIPGVLVTVFAVASRVLVYYRIVFTMHAFPAAFIGS